MQALINLNNFIFMLRYENECSYKIRDILLLSKKFIQKIIIITPDVRAWSAVNEHKIRLTQTLNCKSLQTEGW